MIGLRPRNQDALTNYVKNNPAPQDPSARAAYAQKIEQAYDPLPSSEQAIIAYMQRYGFSTTGTSTSRLLVDFKGTVAQAEQAFSVQLQNFSSPDGQTFYAPNTDPSVSSDIAPFVQSIVGLDSATHFSHPRPIKTGTQQNIPSAAQSSAVTCINAGSGY